MRASNQTPGSTRSSGRRERLLALLLLVWAAAATIPAGAQDAALHAQLDAMEPAIFRDPWGAHAGLQASKPQLAGAPARTQVLFHLREAQALHWLYRAEEFEAAVNAGLALADDATPPRTRALLETLGGVARQRAGNYDEALAMQQRAVEIAAAAGEPFAQVFALAELAYTRTLSGDHETALQEAQRAFTLAVRQDDPFLPAMINEVFAVVYGYMDEYATSIEHYRKALEVYETLGYQAYQAEATNGMAITYRYWKKWDEAIAAFQRYQQLTEHHVSAHGVFTANYGLGMTWAEMGRCDQALPAIGRALAAGGLPDYKAELHKRQAVCLARAGRGAEARRAIAAAREIFAGIPELKGTIWEVELKRSEAQVLAQLGEHRRAFELLTAYNEEAMALQHGNASERLMTLRVAMENTRKDLEIQLLKQQSRLDALELETQRRENLVQRYTGALLIALLFAVLAIFLLQWRSARRFRELSTRDALTGVFNRRYAFEFLERITGSLPPDKGQLSVILLDVDNFKHINDRYGHPAGDGVLKEIAAIGRLVLRGEDCMARIGGEEFLCVLPRTSPANALHVAERFIERVRGHRYRVSADAAVPVTVSMGVASFGPQYRDAASLYAAADQALYAAKSGGRDRITQASAEPP